MIETDPDFEALLVYLKETRGFDFTGYKRSSLMRRVDRRMSQVPPADYAEYLDYLQVHPDEFTALFNTILINVTGFFRDPDAWAALHREVLPRLVAERTGPIRVWSAGCASGEEAYTLAMTLAEVLGIEQFRERVKIYATDVDDEALAHARLATYSARDLQGVDPDLVAKYFEPAGPRYTFRKDMRRSVIFGRNDLVQDAPIGRIDLLVCRNTLMYFNAETQARVVSRFHFALAPGGVLFMGKAEMLLRHAGLFEPLDLRRRIFQRADRVTAAGGPLLSDPPPTPAWAQPPGLDRLRTEAFLASPVAQVGVSADGVVAVANRQAEHLFGLSPRDVGRPFRELDLSYRPVELRGHIEQARAERRTVRLDDIVFKPPGAGEELHFDVQIIPLADAGDEPSGVVIVFHDVTASRRLQEELELANRQLETAYEELQSTNEELETTNEELQSTVEELETTNEELQSTNEELETMNEELQSTNDELQSINDELRDRTAELNNANSFMTAILTSLQAGVIVLDREMRILVWNRRAEDLWGLRSDEAVGRHFLNIDIGLSTAQLRPAIRDVLGGRSERVQSEQVAVNRRGRTVDLRVVCTPLATEPDGVTGAILVMELTTGGNPPGPGAPAASPA
ncbi:CheR family methyltransferase [Dactylosporangium sp. NPDC000555]|uniref:CheR family methyltransferase n=1 Tax=Dactylosporangium sp. NPDC000555 TaxID=3154260 RepID=UPI00332106BA